MFFRIIDIISLDHLLYFFNKFREVLANNFDKIELAKLYKLKYKQK